MCESCSAPSTGASASGRDEAAGSRIEYRTSWAIEGIDNKGKENNRGGTGEDGTVGCEDGGVGGWSESGVGEIESGR